MFTHTYTPKHHLTLTIIYQLSKIKINVDSPKNDTEDSNLYQLHGPFIRFDFCRLQVYSTPKTNQHKSGYRLDMNYCTTDLRYVCELNLKLNKHFCH